MDLFTIGFTQKSARDFFGALLDHRVTLLVDIRLRPGGQLSGFANRRDLPYFCDRLAGGCRYLHLPLLAPTADILDGYRTDHDWARYERRFAALMAERNVPAALDKELFAANRACLLCSEATADQCHRRLVAERIAAQWPSVRLHHL